MIQQVGSYFDPEISRVIGSGQNRFNEKRGRVCMSRKQVGLGRFFRSGQLLPGLVVTKINLIISYSII